MDKSIKDPVVWVTDFVAKGGKIIVVTGDRNYADDSTMFRRFKLLTAGMKNPSDYALVHGDCRGADRMAAAICADLGWNVVAFPADWNKHGRAAGPIRNRLMLVHSSPVMVCAFHDDFQSSKGTKDCVLAALERDIPIWKSWTAPVSKKVYDKITPQDCKDNPDTLFVFGDNVEGWGKSGQSVIRDEPNTLGVPTKISPSVYMTDDFLQANKNDLLWAFSKLELKAYDYEKLFIIPNMGTGRADLPNKAPRTYKALLGFKKMVEVRFKKKLVSVST